MSNPVSRYISNVTKSASELAAARSEASTTKRSVSRQDVKSDSESMSEYKKRMAKTDALKDKQKISAADNKAKEELGQFLGAVLQNRTYVDRKTGRAR
jgi:hypothetical protein